jgi:O-antigen/teichoic acid export membrane protein
MSAQASADHSRMQDSLSALVRGTGVVLLGLIAKMGLVFLTEVVAARHLGPASYGLLTWAITVVAVGSTLTCLGLPTAARRFVPIYLHNRDWARLRGALLLVTVATGVGGVLGLAALYAGAGVLSLRLLGDPAELPIFEVLVFILPLWNLIKAAVAFTAGFKRPGIKVLLEDIVVPFGMLLVVSIVALAGLGAREIALGYVGVYLLSSLVAAFLIRTRTPYRSTAGLTPRFEAREMLGFSWPLILTETLGKATGTIDILILGVLATSADVGVYRVGSDLAATMTAILMCFGYLYLPIASEYFARRDFAGWEALNGRVARWTMLASFPIFAVLFFRSSDVLRILYGAQYARAEPVLLILAASYFLHAMLGFTGSNLVVAGDTRWQMTAHVIALLVKIVGAWLLIPPYGVTGAAIATLAGTFTTNAVNLVVAGFKYRLHPFAAAWWRALLFLIAGAFLLDRVVDRVALGSFGTVAVFVLGLGGLGLVLMRAGILFDREDRQLFSRILSERPKQDS